MTHIRKDAPEGFMYRRKGTDGEFASTVFIGKGVSVDDYELITIEEYNKIQKYSEEEVVKWQV